ncbi:ras-associated and pleckstrin homology domains-containing protein 1 isoform X3 [Anoplophora glabripennis]|uniref:ras-associated and pleckstrin homology domains-containing protein 1 isoform X3 n=1 Tax=Anoplophora glabripennis TaxID=217634 RepID=UPI000873FFFF|nr:ras-associated and pleckstrin homology domains-containing protein 1 isoform X3 [Anoplophora glabripennis]
MSWIRRSSEPVKLSKSIISYDFEDVDDSNSTFSEDSGLDQLNSTAHLRPLNSEITAPRIDSYRFSMANLEDSQDVDLDAILGELCALETVCDREIGHARDSKRLSDVQKMSQHESRTHSRSSSEASRLKLDPEDNLMLKSDSVRTESPDNDSAFSDTVSMLSSESSASSGGSSAKPQILHLQNLQQDDASRLKAEKIRMAMEKIKEANIQKLFLKVFTTDGSAKSLLVDEKMLCSYVTRLLADKNHVQMDPKWAIVEHLPDLYMERFYEDHELLVDNLLLWTRDSKNKIYFVEREDKIKLFLQPEKFLLSVTDKKENNDFDEHSRNMLLEDFFSTTSLPEVEGPLYLKADSKKGWKKYHFVLRASGLYYFPKDKVKSAKDLICLATFDNNQIYYGLGWKKKYKAPTDFCFAIKHPRLQEPKSTKYIKYLCAEDHNSLERWMVGMRVAKFGKQLMDNYRSLMDELAQEDLDILAHARSCSVSSIAVQSLQLMQSNVTTPTQGYPGSEAGYGTQSETYSASTELSSGRHSRASSSSSSGCMSDGAPSSCENAFDSEFPMGTIKRKPSMKPSLPLTNITRQLKEVGETRDDSEGTPLASSPVSYTNSGTLTRRHSRRKTSNSTDDSSSTGTLKRQHSYKSRGSLESMGGRSGTSTPLCSTPVRERASPFSERPPSAGSVRTPISPPSNMDMPSCMTDSITSLPPPPETNGEVIVNDSPNYQLPPPPPEIYNSNLSLDSLPPPPNPSDLPPMTGAELTGSQLSLMSLPPPPGENDTGTIRKRKGSVTPTNVLSPEKTPTVGMSPDLTPTHSRLNTPICSPPLSNVGSNCSTPTQNNPPVSFSPTHRVNYAQNNHIYGSAAQNHDRNSMDPVNNTNGFPAAPPYVNPPQYRQASTLPGSSAFNNNMGLRSSLRQSSLPRQISSNSIASTNSSGSSGNSSVYGNTAYIPELQAKNMQNSPGLQRKVNFQEPSSPKKSNKKISFNLVPQEVPPLPKKPQPPKRSETTKLSSPKKLADPPSDFLKDLQRVMRKKWQVAQKCKLEPDTTPHEVLGFRDPPTLLPDYKEHNVSNWVQEHYGPNNLYENVYRDNPDGVVEYATSPVHTRSEVRSGEFKTKRPPPPPPKRSETTHLSTPKTH